MDQVRIFFVATLLSILPLCAAAQTIEGRLVHVRDADTIEIATSRGRIAVRLNGVDSPELDERGGIAGREWMQRTYGGTMLRCQLNGDRTYDRWVGICYGRGGEDIGAAAISAGYGRDCPRFSGGRYRQFETDQSRSIPMKPYCRPR
ncbi:thermonuclease family protein [Rhodosalinus sp. FB01]|uniref:thermonuclease family protein n=1 Tax=Rhodosalinus sp. FB01 TaxID=3239194 RepID=UPI0035235B32